VTLNDLAMYKFCHFPHFCFLKTSSKAKFDETRRKEYLVCWHTGACYVNRTAHADTMSQQSAPQTPVMSAFLSATN